MITSGRPDPARRKLSSAWSERRTSAPQEIGKLKNGSSLVARRVTIETADGPIEIQLLGVLQK